MSLMGRLFILTICLVGINASAARVKLGNEVLADRGFAELRGKRVGLLTNPSGVNSQGRTTIDLFHRAPQVKLVALFGAEHGVYGTVPAGQEYRDSVDRRTGVKVFSLYGPGKKGEGRVYKPSLKMLSEIDVLVYDLQDTGARSYTFISTMGLAMEQCAKAGVAFMVLDRPNPLGGNRIEGPHFNPRFRSMVGQWPIPYVYGLTCGELARMINGTPMIAAPCRLKVIPMKGWTRDMVWKDTGLKWVPTSPNIPKGNSPLHYVSSGILGEIGSGSGIDIGIGTSRPFEYIAAPWLKAKKLKADLARYPLPGIQLRTMLVVPKGRASKGSMNEGIQFRFTDPDRAPLTPLNFYLLESIKRVCGRDLFRDAVKSGRSWSLFDKVNGTDSTRRDLQNGRGALQIVQSWKAEEQLFQKRRARYLLY